MLSTAAHGSSSAAAANASSSSSTQASSSTSSASAAPRETQRNTQEGTWSLLPNFWFCNHHRWSTFYRARWRRDLLRFRYWILKGRCCLIYYLLFNLPHAQFLLAYHYSLLIPSWFACLVDGWIQKVSLIDVSVRKKLQQSCSNADGHLMNQLVTPSLCYARQRSGHVFTGTAQNCRTALTNRIKRRIKCRYNIMFLDAVQWDLSGLE